MGTYTPERGRWGGRVEMLVKMDSSADGLPKKRSAANGEQRVVVVDVETSGLSPQRGDRVIEIGAVAVSDGSVGEEFHTLIDVDCRIHWAAERVHGISRSMLIGNLMPEYAWESFLEFVRDSPLVAHNARFDLAFIRHEAARIGRCLGNQVHCSLELSRRRFPNLASHKLEAVARHLLGGIPEDCRLHRALGDARLLARVWVAMNGMQGI